MDKWLKRISDVAESYLETLRTQSDRSKKDCNHPFEDEKRGDCGILMASSLNCLFEMDVQRGGHLSRDYALYVNDFYPPVVRITALECFIRLSLSKCLIQRYAPDMQIITMYASSYRTFSTGVRKG